LKPPKRKRNRGSLIAELLRTWRQRKGFSQVEAANRLKMSPRTLQNWEQGHREPKGFAFQQLKEKIK